MQVYLDNYLIDVIIEYKNNKNLYIRFNDDLKMHVTCNRFVTERKILSVIKENEKSLIKMYERQQKEVQNDNFYYYLGEKYTIVYDESIKSPLIDENLIIVKDKKMLDKFTKDSITRIFQERLDKCALMFDNIPKYTLRIRKMKTRWGVNNRGNNTITLNTELIKKDITLIDYVCIHELCHFLEANHSERFWYQVSLRYPYYKRARKMLREV
ncbi:MAG: DUF45 domain-containing protein [Bacilli bacterium]|nr:DUF45 domain-containing protein [Bacilli bacterium]